MSLFRSSLVFCVLLSVFTLSGCQLAYKHEMTQGNIIPEDKLAQLKTGLTMEQVHFLLGTPILDNYMHQDRWDYIYYLKPGYGKTERKHLVVYFKNDKVSEIILPS
jgi:outer membrane protein assembly factor BamE